MLINLWELIAWDRKFVGSFQLIIIHLHLQTASVSGFSLHMYRYYFFDVVFCVDRLSLF